MVEMFLFVLMGNKIILKKNHDEVTEARRIILHSFSGIKFKSVTSGVAKLTKLRLNLT